MNTACEGACGKGVWLLPARDAIVLALILLTLPQFLPPPTDKNHTAVPRKPQKLKRSSSCSIYKAYQVSLQFSPSLRDAIHQTSSAEFAEEISPLRALFAKCFKISLAILTSSESFLIQQPAFI